MDSRLRKLIADYIAQVGVAVELLARAGIPRPATSAQWASTGLTPPPDLTDGVTYHKHGFCCAVSTPSWKVDFDFGDEGRIDGFDEWRLQGFAASRLDVYGFGSTAEVATAFEQAVRANELTYSGYILYYLAPKDAHCE